jgi:hypothetical protein
LAFLTDEEHGPSAIFTEDGARLRKTFMRHWRVPVRVQDDIATVRSVTGAALNLTVFSLRIPQLRDLYPTVLDVHRKHRAIYELELRTALMLADAAAAGYAYAHGDSGFEPLLYHFPTWHAGGRITASAPPLLSTKRELRREYVALPGTRWFSVGWPLAGAQITAALTGDAALMQVFQQDDVTAALEEVLGPEPLPVLYAALNGRCLQADEPGFSPVVSGLHRFNEAFPKIAPWFREQLDGLADGPITLWMGRPYTPVSVKGSTGHNVRSVCSTIVQLNTATALKLLIVSLGARAQLDTVLFKGWAQLLPLYERLYYLIDEKRLDAHAMVVEHIAGLTINGYRLRVTMEQGPTWGDMTPWTPPQIEELVS